MRGIWGGMYGWGMREGAFWTRRGPFGLARWAV
jgi:hypothetical protein